MLASHTLVWVGVPLSRVMRRVSQVRGERYGLLRGLFLGRDEIESGARLHSVALEPGASAIGHTLEELDLAGSGERGAAARRQGAGSTPADAGALRGGRRGGAARHAGSARRGRGAARRRHKKSPLARAFSGSSRALHLAADHVGADAVFRIGSAAARRCPPDCRWPSAARTLPFLPRPSSICVSTEMAILSGRLPEHSISPRTGSAWPRRRSGCRRAGRRRRRSARRSCPTPR